MQKINSRRVQKKNYFSIYIIRFFLLTFIRLIEIQKAIVSKIIFLPENIYFPDYFLKKDIFTNLWFQNNYISFNTLNFLTNFQKKLKNNWVSDSTKKKNLKENIICFSLMFFFNDCFQNLKNSWFKKLKFFYREKYGFFKKNLADKKKKIWEKFSPSIFFTLWKKNHLTSNQFLFFSSKECFVDAIFSKTFSIYSINETKKCRGGGNLNNFPKSIKKNVFNEKLFGYTTSSSLSKVIRL